jgi:hypothetical protein
MARGPRFLLMLLLFALVFYGGIQWERQDCFFTWPGSRAQIGDVIRCPDQSPPRTEPTATTTAT